MNHNATTIGLDIAKHSFYAVGVDRNRHEVLRRKLTRAQVLRFFRAHPSAAIGIEACAGAHYWARTLNAMGHDVRLIAAQHVSRRVVGNKNDYRDAQVITELRGNPQMPFVPINTEPQQDIQMLHRVRERLVTHRTALMLQIRGLLGEYGAVFAPGVRSLRQGLVEVLGGEHLSLSVEDPDALLSRIGAAGAIFLGYHTPEAAGDYAAGPSHVLPTGGAVRFASPLGVYDFVVRSSLIRYSQSAITAQADLLEGLARLEGLEAHAREVTLRRAK